MPIVDAGGLPEATEIAADLVVIGGGMAALTLAREFAGTGVTVAILESGGLTPDKAVQDLNAGEGVQRGPDNPDKPFDEYLVNSRVRVLGGAGEVWGGKCVPMDPADFTERAAVPHSGWPVTRAQMQPFYDRACDLLEIPRFDRDWAAQDPARPPLPLPRSSGFFSAPRFFTKFSGRADPDAFKRFKTAPAEHPNVTVYLNTTVTEIRLDPRGRQVERLDLACLNGRRLTAKGRTYVLATGGIENARLLLASTSVIREGVGNQHDLVGRYFQGHVTYSVEGGPTGDGPAIHLTRPQPMTLYSDNGRDKVHCVIASSLAGQKRFGTGAFTMTLGPARAFDEVGPAAPGLKAVRELASRLDGGAPAAGRHIESYFMTENLPNPDSRVSLSDRTDALGQRRARLEWVYTRADWDLMDRSIEALAAELGAAGLGRLGWSIDRSKILAATSESRHHMGTTRMHADPRQGVVDVDCRMHGVGNLYVAGSSVFPTSAIANPTLTLMALAMRLADHLKAGAAR